MITTIAPYLIGLLCSPESANCVSLARVVHQSHDHLSRILKNRAIEWKTLLSSLVLRIAGKLQGGAGVARRYEGEREQKLEALLVGKQTLDDLHDDHQPAREDHAPRHIEDRL